MALVLERDVAHHVAFIRACTDHMPRGSMVLVTVPAFQFLWSGHDVFLGHKRRYTRASLHRAIDEAGLKVIRSRYFFSILLPVVCAIRLGGRLRLASSGLTPRSDLRVHSRWTNALLMALHELERHTLFHINQLAGLIVFCLAKRR